MKICLLKYTKINKNYGKYIYDSNSFKYKLEIYDDLFLAKNNCTGYGDEIKVGLLKKKNIFVGIYLKQDMINLIFDKEIYPFSQNTIIRWKSFIGGIRKFVLKEENKIKVKLYYSIFYQPILNMSNVSLFSDILCYIYFNLKDKESIEIFKKAIKNTFFERNSAAI